MVWLQLGTPMRAQMLDLHLSDADRTQWLAHNARVTPQHSASQHRASQPFGPYSAEMAQHTGHQPGKA